MSIIFYAGGAVAVLTGLSMIVFHRRYARGMAPSLAQYPSWAGKGSLIPIVMGVFVLIVGIVSFSLGAWVSSRGEGASSPAGGNKGALAGDPMALAMLCALGGCVLVGIAVWQGKRGAVNWRSWISESGAMSIPRRNRIHFGAASAALGIGVGLFLVSVVLLIE